MGDRSRHSHPIESLLDQFDAALAKLHIDPADIARARTALQQLSPAVTSGFMKAAISGVTSLGGFVTGSILSVLIMYYLVKDATLLRTRIGARMSQPRRAQFELFVTDACFVLRRYWLGRTIVSAVVAAVVGVAAFLLGLPLVLTITAVTFIGGYIPYVGAILGGLLAVVIAVGTNGVGSGIAMLIVVLVANLLIENLVEPAITGRTLEIHPLMVLLVTTARGHPRRSRRSGDGGADHRHRGQGVRPPSPGHRGRCQRHQRLRRTCRRPRRLTSDVRLATSDRRG